MRQPRDEPIVTESGDSSSRAGTNELVETCDLCGSAAYRLLLGGVSDRLHRLPGEFNLIRCSGCSLVRLSPRPDAASIPAYYPGEYYAFRVAPPAGVPDRPLAHLRDAVRDAALRGYGYETPQPVAVRDSYRAAFRVGSSGARCTTIRGSRPGSPAVGHSTSAAATAVSSIGSDGTAGTSSGSTQVPLRQWQRESHSGSRCTSGRWRRRQSRSGASTSYT